MSEVPNITAPNGMPRPEVGLVGQDLNAFAILAECQRAMRLADFPKADIDKFYDEAVASDYNHLLQTARVWCRVT